MKVAGAAVPDVVPSATRGGGQRRGGRGQRGGGYKPPQTPSAPKKSAFAGSVKDLDGAVFDLAEGAEQAILYEETLKAILHHIGNTYDNGDDVTGSIVNDLTQVEFDLPADLPENASAAAKRAWNKKVDLVAVSEDKLERNLKRLYALVLAQTSDPLLTKVMEQDEYEDIAATRDGLGLLACIRNVMQDYEDSDYGPEQSRKAKLMLLNCIQRKNQDLKTYYNAFKTMVKVVKSVGANIGPDDATITLVRGYVTPVRAAVPMPGPDAAANAAANAAALAAAAAATKEAYREAALECELALHFLRGADTQKYRPFVEDIQNSFNAGTDKYPKTVHEAFNRLNKWKNSSAERTGGTDAMAFTQVGYENDEDARQQRENQAQGGQEPHPVP